MNVEKGDGFIFPTPRTENLEKGDLFFQHREQNNFTKDREKNLLQQTSSLDEMQWHPGQGMT